MKCNNCGSNQKSGVKFCASCGSPTDLNQPQVPPQQGQPQVPPQQGQPQMQPQQGQHQVPPQQGQPQMQPQQGQPQMQPQQGQPQMQPQQGQPQMPYQNNMPQPNNAKVKSGPSFKEKIQEKKKLITGIAIVTGIVASVALVANIVLSTPSLKVARAVTNTTNSAAKEIEDIRSKATLFSFFDDIFTSQYQFTYYHDGFGKMSLYSDYGNSKIKTDVTVMGVDNSLLLSDKYLTVESDLIPKTYGVNLSTLAKDLNNNMFIDMSVPDNFNPNIFDFDLELYNKIVVVCTDSLKNALGDIEIEKIDDEKIKIDGKYRELDTYSLYISSRDLESLLLDMVDDIFSDSDIKKSLQVYLDYYNIASEINAQNSWYYNHEDVTIDMIKILYKAGVAEIISSYKELERYDVVTSVSIYKNKIAQFKMEDEDRDGFSIVLASMDNILEDISFCEISNGKSSEVMSLSMKMDKDDFSYVVKSYGEKIEIDYDTKGTRNNFKITVPYSETIAMTVNTTKKNTMIIEYDGVELEIEKDSFGSNWFSQPSDFTNVLDLSYGDMMDLAMMFF